MGFTIGKKIHIDYLIIIKLLRCNVIMNRKRAVKIVLMQAR